MSNNTKDDFMQSEQIRKMLAYGVVSKKHRKYIESFKQYCLTETNDPEENKWRQRLYKEYIDERDPDSLPRSYRDKVHWRCSKCNHEWDSILRMRVERHIGCPKCSKRLVTQERSLEAYSHGRFKEVFSQQLPQQPKSVRKRKPR